MSLLVLSALSQKSSYSSKLLSLRLFYAFALLNNNNPEHDEHHIKCRHSHLHCLTSISKPIGFVPVGIKNNNNRNSKYSW